MIEAEKSEFVPIVMIPVHVTKNLKVFDVSVVTTNTFVCSSSIVMVGTGDDVTAISLVC